MVDQFVTYEIASKLKELGFNEKCLAYHFTLNGRVWEFALKEEYDTMDEELNIGSKFTILAPLWQQVIDWFEKKYDTHIVITVNPYSNLKEVNGYKIYNSELRCVVNNENFTLSRCVAREKAILEAIKFVTK